MKAAIEVGAAEMVCVLNGSSSIYRPGYVGVTGTLLFHFEILGKIRLYDGTKPNFSGTAWPAP
jgi:hypothetical protein